MQESDEALQMAILKEFKEIGRKIVLWKLRKGLLGQQQTAKIMHNQGGAIRDSKGKVRARVKASIDPILAHQLRVKRHKENPYLKANNLSPFADPEFLPYLQKTDPAFRVPYNPAEGKIFVPNTDGILKGKTLCAEKLS
jgi:hypothetical protein